MRCVVQRFDFKAFEPQNAQMLKFPLRSRQVEGIGIVHANEAGRFFATAEGAALGSVAAHAFLLDNGHAADGANTLQADSHELQVLARDTVAGELDYLILVPTLRCNLSCSYCQVSRADASAAGYDWSDETLSAVLAMLDRLSTDSIKIEFQGGEPTLRLDLVRAVIERCDRFSFKQFVICTNLSELSDELRALLARPDVSLSTSLDGDALVHSNQRTKDTQATQRFFGNLRSVLNEFGSGKVSALPTIDQANPPPIDSLIESYWAFGFRSIYLRPINYQGFARKRHPGSRDDHAQWWTYYDAFVARLIERNFADRSQVLEESYLSLCLRRIFRIGLDRHVDLRNPNPVGVDYVVIDYDGRVYPTDEARMLTRSGVVDLCIGDVWQGFESEARRTLDAHSTTHGDPACDACLYQPFCGRDLIDDLSRYGRIDLPRHDTFFCRKHLHLFDLCMRLIYSDDPATSYSLAKWLGLAGDALPRQAKLV